MARGVKNLPAVQETQEMQVQSQSGDPLKKKMAICSSILSWKIPWTEEPGRLQSKGLEESDMTKHAGTLCSCIGHTYQFNVFFENLL